MLIGYTEYLFAIYDNFPKELRKVIYTSKLPWPVEQIAVILEKYGLEETIKIIDAAEKKFLIAHQL